MAGGWDFENHLEAHGSQLTEQRLLWGAGVCLEVTFGSQKLVLGRWSGMLSSAQEAGKGQWRSGQISLRLTSELLGDQSKALPLEGAGKSSKQQGIACGSV